MIVLLNVAYATDIHTREQRAKHAKDAAASVFDDKQQEFIEFILTQYVKDGEDELAPRKMRSLIELKYSNINDAIDVLGSPAKIRETFIGFQKYLYS